MALFGLSCRERMLEYDCIDLLPDLEEDVQFVDVIVPDLEESFTAGLDDWWGDFVSDMYL